MLTKGSKAARTNKNIRLTLDLTQEFYARLEKLEARGAVVGKANIIRQALQLYEYLVEQHAKGYTFKTVSPHGSEATLIILGTTPPRKE
jgi:hypothetical protein